VGGEFKRKGGRTGTRGRRSAILVTAWVALAGAGVGAQDAIETRDLAADGAVARSRGVPVVLMFSASYCGYCVQVRESFLGPMEAGGHYAERVLIRELSIDRALPVRGFDGRRRSPAAVAARYNVRVTPTLVFLDPHGTEVAPRLEGLSTPDLFGLYLSERMDRSLAVVRGAGGAD
jgi:thioredoxin-related protein